MRQIDQHHHERRNPWLRRGKARAAALGDGDEQHDEPDEDQARIGGEQQETERDSGREPVAAAIFDQRPIDVEQRKRAQRHGEHAGPEFERRDGEDGDPGHEQDRHRGVRGADDAPPEREHGPEGYHHAGLGQQIEADDAAAGELEGKLGQPVREWRTIGRAELHSLPTASTSGTSPGGAA